jgi:[ribosomal protein S5]-alanine N-acetyltransferase
MHHFAELAAFNRDARVMDWLGGGAEDDEETRAWIEEKVAYWRRDGFGLWVLTVTQTGAFAGRAGLRHIDIEGVDEVELLYALRPESWGRGLATEAGQALLYVAFSLLRAASVVAYTLPHNVRSRRVIEKLGFVYERDYLHEGEPHVLYRVTAEQAHTTAVTPIG